MKKCVEGATEIEVLEVDGLGTVTKGLTILHPHFGHGTVTAIFLLHQNRVASHAIGIEFDLFGYQTIVPSYAKMSRADA